MDAFWVWQQADWPKFSWREESLAPLLRVATQHQGQLLGKAEVTGASGQSRTTLDTLLQNLITSSAIEGEQLNVGPVRSSLARRLHIEEKGSANTTRRSEGLAQLMLDATTNLDELLTVERLFQWHRWLFPEGENNHWGNIRIGTWRGEEPMQVVSGRVDKPHVHFEAPPRTRLEQEVETFLQWFNTSRENAGLDPLLRAGIAHFWFVTLHPFDDGNGRLARTIADLALAQADKQTIRLYSMSAAILERRADYYRVLEHSQKASLDITDWLQWFVHTLDAALLTALAGIDRVLNKTRFWQQHAEQGLHPMQVKVLNRLLDGGEGNFEHGISAAQYQAVAKVSKATATRHLTDLLEKGCLVKLPGGGRSTRYHVPGWATPNTENGLRE